MNSGYQNSGFRNMNRPQNPAYPAQNYQAYNQYQNRRPAYRNAGPAYPPRDQQALPAPPAQRQITAGPNQNPQQNGYGSRQPYQQYQPRLPYQTGQSRPSQFGPTANRPPYQQRAYQASVEEELPPSESQNESENLDSFYTDYPGESDHQTEDPDNDYLNLDAQHSGAEAEVNFIDTQPISEHFCHLYKQPFKSRNKLFHHLKDVY